LIGFFFFFWLERVLDGRPIRSLGEVIDVDAGALAEDAPEEARSVEKERLDQEHHRYPLVVADVVLDGARLKPDRKTPGT